MKINNVEVKVGMLLRVKSGMTEGEVYGYCFANNTIVESANKVLRVKAIIDGFLTMCGYSDNLYWNIDMFSDVVEEELKCSKCGKDIESIEDALFDAMGSAYCKECCEDSLVRCDGTGRTINKMIDKYYEFNGKIYCESYYKEHFKKCQVSNEVYHIDDMVKVEDGYVHKDNLTDEYVKCDNCEVYHKKENMYKFGDVSVCKKCIQSKAQGTVMGYHDFEDWEIKTTDKDGIYKSIPVGFELEVERVRVDRDFSNDVAAYIAKQKTKGLAVFERDGSLSNGFEIITHPMTMGYLKSNAMDKFKDMCEFLTEIGYSSEPSSCGLHFHVSKKALKTSQRSQDEVIDNIVLIVETFKEEIYKFARRSSNRYSRYLTESSDLVTLKTVKIKKQKSRDERYDAVNLTNRNTIEFRFFRGTLNFETLMASFEFVNNVVNIAKYREIDGLRWEDIINYRTSQSDFIVKYNESLNLASTTKVMVMSQFERSRRNYTLKNFLKGKFAIKANGRDSSDYYVLLGVLLGRGVTHHAVYSSLRDCLSRKYSNRETMFMKEFDGKNRLISANSEYSCDEVIELSDIINLWNEERDLVA